MLNDFRRSPFLTKQQKEKILPRLRPDAGEVEGTVNSAAPVYGGFTPGVAMGVPARDAAGTRAKTVPTPTGGVGTDAESRASVLRGVAPERALPSRKWLHLDEWVPPSEKLPPPSRRTARARSGSAGGSASARRFTEGERTFGKLHSSAEDFRRAAAAETDDYRYTIGSLRRERAATASRGVTTGGVMQSGVAVGTVFDDAVRRFQMLAREG